MPLAEHCPLCSVAGEFVSYEDGRRWERWACPECGHDWRVEGPGADRRRPVTIGDIATASAHGAVSNFDPLVAAETAEADARTRAADAGLDPDAATVRAREETARMLGREPDPEFDFTGGGR